MQTLSSLLWFLINKTKQSSLRCKIFCLRNLHTIFDQTSDSKIIFSTHSSRVYLIFAESAINLGSCTYNTTDHNSRTKWWRTKWYREKVRIKTSINHTSTLTSLCVYHLFITFD